MEYRKDYYPKYVLFIVLSFLITLTSFSQNAADFSGDWLFNESGSIPGEGGFRMISQKLTITQDDKNFTVSRSFKGQNGEERKMSETYSLNGKESVNQVFNSSKRSIVKWSSDKRSVTVSSVMIFEINGEKNEIKTVETYKMADSDRSLSIEFSSSSLRGERKATLLYDKK